MKECCETGEPRKKRHWRWVVLGCVGIIAAALQLIPSRPFINYMPASVRAKADLAAILDSLSEYALDNKGSYPNSLVPLVTPDANGRWYLDGFNGHVPKDPWKREYQYEPPTPEHPKPHVWSYGADGKRGGTGDDADIDSDSLSDDP